MKASDADEYSIQPLPPGSPWLDQMASDQFNYWGPLTGYSSPVSYKSFLDEVAHSTTIPRILLATTPGSLLGSVNLLARELTIRPQFTPWLGQLFVTEGHREKRVGAKLIDAAISYVHSIGYGQLFLFTSGTLPAYYRRLGWSDVEEVTYLDKQRTIMRFDIERRTFQ
jgi:GNAT superfamily N-acetyltransferase